MTTPALKGFEDERAYLAAWRLLVAAALASAALLAIVWACGGLAAVAKKDLPVIAAGDRLQTDDWFLRPLRAQIVTRTPTGKTAPAGGAFLILELEAENRTRATRVDIDTAVRWLGDGDVAAPRAATPGTQADAVVLLRDPAFGAQLQPGMAERIALIWNLPPQRTLEGAQEWLLMGRQWVAKDRLSGGGNWLNRRALARTRIDAVDPRTSAGAVP